MKTVLVNIVLKGGEDHEFKFIVEDNIHPHGDVLNVPGNEIDFIEIITEPTDETKLELDLDEGVKLI